jgi:hypothetical protein
MSAAHRNLPTAHRSLPAEIARIRATEIRMIAASDENMAER